MTSLTLHRIPSRAIALFAATLVACATQQPPEAATIATPVAAAAVAPASGYALSPYTYRVKGWASGTQGGAGGRIVKVTTLAESGPGSLREAIEASGPRIVVFEVGGVIDAAGRPFTIKHPFITIAGQTAPPPGVTLIKAETMVATHDVIIQHLSFRPGEFGRPKKGGNDQDGLSTLAGAHDVIVDHCSFSWATDENLSASGPRFAGDGVQAWRRNTSHRITYSHNLIYEGLSRSVHVKGEHSKGSLIHDNATGILLLGNAYISNRERSALFKGGTQGAMVNNLIFNPGTRAAHYGLVAGEWQGQQPVTGRLTLAGNVLQHGPDTAASTPLFMLTGAGDVELHLSDNLAFDTQGRPLQLPLALVGRGASARILSAGAPDLPDDVHAIPAARLASELPSRVGARPWDRDARDQRVLADMALGRGRIIDSELENALGYPTSPPSHRRFDAAEWNLADLSPRAGWASLAPAAAVAGKAP